MMNLRLPALLLAAALLPPAAPAQPETATQPDGASEAKEGTEPRGGFDLQQFGGDGVPAPVFGNPPTGSADFGGQDGPVTAELLIEHPRTPPGEPLRVAVRLTPDAGWHTYWLNPGDAGRGTQTRFSGLPGLAVDGPQWPAPKAKDEGELVTYGFSETHTLLYTLTPPADLEGPQLLQARVDWLVCKAICIPGGATLREPLDLGPRGPAAHGDVFAAAEAALPAPASGPPGRFQLAEGELRLALPPGIARGAEVFPARPYLVDHAVGPRWADAAVDGTAAGGAARLAWPLAFEGVETPEQLRAVVVSAGQARWVDFEAGAVAAVPPADPVAGAAAAAGDASPTMLLALLFALGGGLLLNLMPCVFPVLAIKAMGLARGDNLAAKRQEALLYTAGVLASTLLLALLLLGLRATGAALGWGFQLQNPAVVAGLAVLMAFLGLALAGWTQIGVRWMGWGQGLTHGDGPRAAFFTGVLAVVVASPCTAPFMGVALGYAVTQPALVALAIFASLGLGLALPILVLAGVPALAKRLPRPGPWMDRFKLLMALPLLGTAVWLYWVVWNQAGLLAVLLGVAALALLATVTYQRRDGRPLGGPWLRGAGLGLATALVLAPALLPPAQSRLAGDWQPWSQARVAELRAAGEPVFVDFTADWCITCLVNERAAIADPGVQRLIAAKGVVLLKADWTRQDPAVTAGLAEFGRNGVPLYLLYDRAGEVEVLPQLLTPGMLREALRAL